ncbi:MAG: small ribosomal subunit Rsm22 family protein [Candidatus Levyibacteriota bacterium]
MTFANLPSPLEKAISEILQNQPTVGWLHRASELHERYLTAKMDKKSYVHDFEDALAYLGMRVPATYAQIYGALTTIQESIPSWKPQSILDIGSGPGTGGWAAISHWPDLLEVDCLDQNKDFIQIGKQIAVAAQLQQKFSWKQHDLRDGIADNEKVYDLIIIANVLNELNQTAQEKIIGQAFNKCAGVLLVIEPGTPRGSEVVSAVAQKLSKVGNLLAPYIANTFVQDSDYYLHFPQRFIRPDFQRRIRQHMRVDAAKASDWEEAKYSYVAISRMASEKEQWGRCVGQVHIQKGFLEVPVLRAEGVTKIKIMKRNKEKFSYAKRLRWGDVITRNLNE